jgi:hypothetical protein
MRRTGLLVFLGGILGLFQLSAWTDQETLSITRSGPHEAVHQRVKNEVDAYGNLISVTNSWIQLEDGLNYWDDREGAWLEAREEIELTATGAIALRGQHRAIFSSNVNDPAGALDIEIQHQVRLLSSVLALGFFDPVSA